MRGALWATWRERMLPLNPPSQCRDPPELGARLQEARPPQAVWLRMCTSAKDASLPWPSLVSP